MSIIMGALGGAGEAMQHVGSTMLKSELDRETQAQGRVQESNLALQRQKALEAFKMELGNKERTDQTARIDTAAGKLADAKVAPTRAAVEGGIVDRASWTPEQQAAVDQSLAQDRAAAVTDPKVRTQAAINTGDIGPKDAATIMQKDDKELYKMLWEQRKEDGRNDRSDARLAAQQETSDKRLAYLFSALEKRGEKKAGTDTAKEALQFLDGSRKEIASEATNLRQMYQAQIKDKSRGEVAKIDAEYQPKFAEIERKRSEIEEDYGHVRERVGLPPRVKPAAAPAAPAPAPGAAPAAAPKPAGKASAPGTRPPLNSFLK